MKIFQLIIESLNSLNASKVRSGLTMLGIVIGVAAVVAMMSIGAGAQNSITNQINSVGTNLLYVNQYTRGVTNAKPLTLGDAQALSNKTLAPSISKVAPILRDNVTVTTPGESTSTSMTAVTADYFTVQTVKIAEGAAINQKQLDGYSTVVLLGSTTAKNLFGKTTGLVGESVRIQGQVFKVIGVLKSTGGNGFRNNDDQILIPLTTAQLRLSHRGQADQVDMIYVQATDSNSVTTAQDLITRILRTRHGIATGGTDDFEIQNTQSLLETASTVTNILTIFLGGVAGISLLVGGIGIMNIMLVTVSERTREIGLRKAVGARKNDIRMQFLVESLLLSLGGGMIGVATGWGISLLVGKIAASFGTTLTPSVQMSAVLLATLFSAAVGIFFGLYPANRAASLEPVEALRSE
jgi:putative ABC transport system permease protein